MMNWWAVRKLSKAIVRLHEELPRVELLPREVLDILWMARLIGPGSAAADVPPPTAAPLPPREPPAASRRETTGKPPRSAIPITQQRRPPSMRPQSQPLTSDAGVHAPSEREKGKPGVAARPLRAPGPPPPRETLSIARSLLPLRKRVGSRSNFVFDEVATAEQFAETRILEPVFRPTPEGWLDLALVAHVAGSMHFWWRSIEELRVVLERHSAFRHVRSWRLTDEQDGSLSLRAWSARGQVVQHNELLTSGGRLLIVVVSDCVSPAWSDRRMASLLSGWSATGPVSIFQVLPRELWRRTEMRRVGMTSVKSTEPGALNRQLIPARRAPDTLPVPVTTLERTMLTEWARVIAGAGGAVGDAILLPLEFGDAPLSRARLPLREERPDGAERVARFDHTASSDARELARLFAGAPYPLTHEILRMIQEAILPGSSPSAVAEVLLSGLMKRLPSSSGDDFELMQYTFTDDDVRERLLETATAADLLQVVRLLESRLPEFEGATLATILDFGALIADSNAPGDHTIGPSDEPFARIGLSALRRLGGEYREIADRIEIRMQSEKRDAGGRGTLTGRRFALQERLREITHNESADGFVRSLYEWGLPVVVLAALAAAARVMTADDAAQRELLDLGYAALKEQATSAASRIFAKIGDEPSADATPAAHAARAAAIAFHGDKAPRNGTLEAATRCALAAVERAGGDHSAIVGAMAQAIHENVLSENSVVSEALPVRAWILVAGSEGQRDLPSNVYNTAAALGTELGANGFRLISGGKTGVDFMTSLALTVQVELSGGEIETRLLHVYEGDRPDFDYGSKRPVAGDWIEQMLGGHGLDVRPQAVVTIGGGGGVAELIRRAGQYGIPVLPLPWTGGTSRDAAVGRQWRFGRRGVLESRETMSPAEIDLLVRRVVRYLGTATDPTLKEQWTAYSNTVFTIVQAATEPPLEQRAPRLNYWLKALEVDGAKALDDDAATLNEALNRFASFFPQWLVDDLVEMTEFEHDAFTGDDVVDRFARLAALHAHDLALGRLEQCFRALAEPLPRASAELLPAAARSFFGGYSELDAWTKKTISMDAAECFFRATIPFETFRLAESYIEHDPTPEAERFPEQIRHHLANLAPRREYVRRFSDQKEEAARVIGYVFMLLFDLGIGPVELASRIEAEARECAVGTRPFRQLMFATESVVPRFDGTACRIVARALADAADVIARQSSSPLHREIRERIDALLRGRLAEATAQNATINEEATRYFAAETAKKEARTGVDRLPSSLRRMTFSASEVEYLFSHGPYEWRFLALRLASETDGRTPFETIRQALLKPLYTHETMPAVTAADRVAERLTHSQIVVLIELVEKALNKFWDDEKAAKYARGVLARLLKQRDNADHVRFAPIAILGSDPTGATFRDFVQDLGERLAASELGVVTANATFGSWLWEGYRRRIPDAQSFIVLRRAADERPLLDSVPTHTVEGSLADLSRELLSRAKGAILIGGGRGAFREYERATKNRDLPVVAIAAAGGASRQVSAATRARLEALGIAAEALREDEMSVRVAAAAANLMSRALLAIAARSDQALAQRSEAAALSSQQLIDVVAERRPKASRRTLEAARSLVDAIERDIHWSGTPDELRRIDRYVQSLRPEFAGDMYVAELTARCAFVYTLLELSSVPLLHGVIESLATHRSLSVVPDELLQQAMQLLATAVIEDPVAQAAAARLREQIRERNTSSPVKESS